MNWLDYSKKSSSGGNEVGTNIDEFVNGFTTFDSFKAPEVITGDSEGFGLGNPFSDKHTMGNITGLAGTLAQLASLPLMKKQAELNNEITQYNFDTTKEENAKHAKKAANFASAGTRYT